MAERLDTQIYRIDGKNCFLEVLNSAFSIGKVQMNFIQYDEASHKQTQKLEFYFDFNTALYFCNLITSGRLDKAIAMAAQTNSFDGKPVNDYTSYFTEMGGTNCKDRTKWEKYHATFSWLSEGASISRQFKVQKGNKCKYVFRIEYGNGTINEKGLIVPTGKSSAYINVPVTEKDAIAMALTIQMEMQAYRNQFYMTFASKLFPGQKCNTFERKPQEQGGNLNFASSSPGDGFVPTTPQDDVPFR